VTRLSPISYNVGEAWVTERYDPILAELLGEPEEVTHYLNGEECERLETRLKCAGAVREHREAA
jgi:hypothetical protein